MDDSRYASKVFVVEDDDNIRELVEFALKGVGFNTRGFGNGLDFLRCVGSDKDVPDIVLIDIMLPQPGGDGLEVLRRLKAMHDIPVIIITAMGSEHERIRGLELGADDYVTKPFSVLELLSRVKAVLRRSLPITPHKNNEVLTAGKISLNSQERTVHVGVKQMLLTFKEYELLYFMLSHQGIVMSREKLLGAVWGHEFLGETRTVDMHIRKLRVKLGEHADKIETVRNVGYRIIP